MIRALLPSTSKILRTGHNETFQQVARLSRSLPCHEFLIGNDPMEATTVLRGFLRRSESMSDGPKIGVIMPVRNGEK
ncbi:hypothetical protein ACVOMV_13150 [Mesorhizobium atlanticum]